MPGRRDVGNPDDKIMKGSPNDGDVYEDDPPRGEEGDPAPTPAPTPTPESEELKALKKKLDEQAEEMAELRRRTPPPTPKDPAPTPTPETQDEFERRLYANPKAVLQAFGEEIEERVTKKLTSEYQRDRATQRFWDQFYEKHPDLKADHDLVDITLQSHLGEMGSMPVDKAIDRVADLTRERILRYAGGAAKARSPRARAEGGSNPAAPAPTKPKSDDDVRILSITDIIKERKEKRRRAAIGA